MYNDLKSAIEFFKNDKFAASTGVEILSVETGRAVCAGGSGKIFLCRRKKRLQNRAHCDRVSKDYAHMGDFAPCAGILTRQIRLALRDEPCGGNN